MSDSKGMAHGLIIGAMLIGVVASLTSCTDAERARRAAYGNQATVRCYSASQLMFEGRSTGKIIRDDGMLSFADADSGAYTQVEGECVVVYDVGNAP